MRAIVKTAVLATSVPTGACTTVPARRSPLASLPRVATDTRSVKVNGIDPAIGKHGALLCLDGVRTGRALSIPGRSIAFAAADQAGNAACG